MRKFLNRTIYKEKTVRIPMIEGPSPQKMREEDSALNYARCDFRAAEERVIKMLEEHEIVDPEKYVQMDMGPIMSDNEYDVWVEQGMPLDGYAQADDTTEIPQCPSCKLYTDDTEHWCGSLALVNWIESPQHWRGFLNFSLLYRRYVK